MLPNIERFELWTDESPIAWYDIPQLLLTKIAGILEFPKLTHLTMCSMTLFPFPFIVASPIAVVTLAFEPELGLSLNISSVSARSAAQSLQSVPLPECDLPIVDCMRLKMLQFETHAEDAQGDGPSLEEFTQIVMPLYGEHHDPFHGISDELKGFPTPNSLTKVNVTLEAITSDTECSTKLAHWAAFDEALTLERLPSLQEVHLTVSAAQLRRPNSNWENALLEIGYTAFKKPEQSPVIQFRFAVNVDLAH
ncbi:hypothetical protein NLJ89_g990 [Agrocybe chaxingu]|uniref:Uncharacterized protein n=1 Tax=Agrocybe chaxingu TaxID=84603 RepID=A0A9W8N0Y5_9AGAR|nr:hypothetical protein NLJ89_g990 [Agrocybe chaxingu]